MLGICLTSGALNSVFVSLLRREDMVSGLFKGLEKLAGGYSGRISDEDG